MATQPHFRLTLTDEQKEEIRKVTGKEAEELELSVEELEVTGAGPRQTSAVQPPRVIHLGVRIPF